MDAGSASLRNISDTALWVAEYRARESERPDAVFRDPFARRLAGDRGRRIVDALPRQANHAWAYVARTYLFDQFVADEIARGTDLILNLAAGLDTRPYRMTLPPSLAWVEVDLPDLLAYKSKVLERDRPVCRLERVAVDLNDREARLALFRQVDRRAARTLVLCEGLLIYLTPEEAGWLAEDMAACPSFRSWAIDIASPGLVAMLQKQIGRELDRAGAPFRFAPAEGPAYFERYGWNVGEIRGVLKTAARLKRVPLLMRLFALIPERQPAGSRPWSGVCLLTRESRP
jgi:methyltransferase (TIGR00027 family)